MSKVIEVTDTKVLIGTDDGKIKEARRDDIKFEPKVGDEVDVFENDDTLIVTKKAQNNPVETPQGGVNININNTNTNNSQQEGYIGNGKKVVNKIVYILLALFLGGIGGHKFYAGKIGAGVCYLLFCWTGIPAFIALIELIVALCTKSDSNGNILV